MSDSHMTLGEVIAELKKHPPERVCAHGFNHPHSYRGYYYELSFEPTDDVTVGSMLACAEKALGHTFQGWKGGDYAMHADTVCHISEEGSSGDGTQITLDRLLAMIDGQGTRAELIVRAEAAEKRAAEMESAWHEAMADLHRTRQDLHWSRQREFPEMQKRVEDAEANYAAARDRADVAEKRVKELESTDRLGDALAARAVKRATEEEESMRKLMLEALEERDAAQKRVKELEAEAAGVRSALGNALVTGGMNWPLGDRVAEVMKHGAEENKKFVEAANRADRAEYALKDAQARITQLEADLAAAKTFSAHKLVADVVNALRKWADLSKCTEELFRTRARDLEAAHEALRAAGITVQPVRTYTREEAGESLAHLFDLHGAMENALHALSEAQRQEYVGTHNEEAAYVAAKEAFAAALERHKSALMSVPVAQAARVVAQSANITRLQRFAEYVRDCGIVGQDDTVMRQRACEALGQEGSSVLAPQAPQGNDEAGGEGPAAAHEKPDEVARLLDKAAVEACLPSHAYESQACTATASAVENLVKAIRLINAKVDALARKA